MWQITQCFLNAHFTDVIIQKLIIRKFFNNYRAYIRMKTKMIIMRHKAYMFIKECFGHSLWKIKHHSLEKAKLNFAVIAVNKNKQSWFVFNFSPF